MSARRNPEHVRAACQRIIASRRKRHAETASVHAKLCEATNASLRQTIRTRKKERRRDERSR